jgi:hypothetical protein
MNPHDPGSVRHPNWAAGLASDTRIEELFGQVYGSAQATERSLLLEQLLRPLGVLSPLSVANGIFAKVLFRSGRKDLRVRFENMQHMRVRDVITLVEHVRRVSVEALIGVANLISEFTMTARSNASAQWVMLLHHVSKGGNPFGAEIREARQEGVLVVSANGTTVDLVTRKAFDGNPPLRPLVAR